MDTQEVWGTTVRYFGNHAQQRMQRSAHHLWTLLHNDPAFGYEGRSVGVDGASPRDVPLLAALARVQGASISHYTHPEDEAALVRDFTAQGFATDHWDQFMGNEACLAACRAEVRKRPIPESYRLHRITPETAPHWFDRLAETALACHVLPPASTVLTAETQRAVCLFLEAPDGQVAACAGAVMRNHRESPYGTASWWGMLAVREADRGRALSLALGARVALHMHETFGADTFYTGVRRDNAVSRHVCARLGVVESGLGCLAVLDPEAFGGAGFTK
ncbi:hypothetical protein [Rhodobacteraceae bacterium DSL-40]|uniref:hypothetical protein n=1 Tax=Amaricoccus sp. B4 TaxID=3368557 RepID=UPI000DACDA83